MAHNQECETETRYYATTSVETRGRMHRFEETIMGESNIPTNPDLVQILAP